MTAPIVVKTTGAMGITGVAVRLVYDPADPYAVVVYVWNWYLRKEVRWTFARDLLDAGVTCATDQSDTGEGNVMITRVNEHTTKITNHDHNGRNHVVLGSHHLKNFLDATYELVQRGHEQPGYDDSDLAALLAQPGSRGPHG